MNCDKCPDNEWCSSEEMDKFKCPVKELRELSESYKNAYKIISDAFELKVRRPKGKWLNNGFGGFINYGRDCSICGYNVQFSTNFCPNCGADMRVKDDDIQSN